MRVLSIQKSVNFKSDDSIKNKTKTWSRMKSSVTSFIFGAALVDIFVNQKLTDIIIKKKNIVKPSANLSIGAFMGFGILAVGALLGLAFNAYDSKHNTKLGDYFYKVHNGPNAKIENDKK